MADAESFNAWFTHSMWLNTNRCPMQIKIDLKKKTLFLKQNLTHKREVVKGKER